MKNPRNPTSSIMKKYYQLILIIACFVSIITLLIYRHEYYRLRYVLEVLNFFGKPGLSVVEFCGPGFNATMLTEILRNSSMEVRQTPPLFQQIDENFYSYSSFLRSHQKYEQLTRTHVYNIDTIVIGKAHVRPNFRCNIWLENLTKPKAGRFTFKTMSEPLNEYRLYIFHCSLNQNIGKPIGISFYVNDYNINPIHAPISKVIQVTTKRKLRESSSIQFVNNIEPALCVIPNQVPLVTKDAFIEFLLFHHMMGVKHFTIYDSIIPEDVIRRLNLLPMDITQWQIQFFPLNYPFVFAKSYEVVRNAIELDCLFRHFRLDKDVFKASHVIVLSWDEFLVPRIHTNLKAVLDDIDPTRKLRTLEVKPLLFCLNQNDDDNAESSHPDIMKKTHYYSLPQYTKTICIRNLDSMTMFDDIFNLNSNNHVITLDIIGVHKYSECRDPKNYSGLGYNDTQMQLLPHKFEGAMLKFGQSLLSNTIYRMYKEGKIWEKSTSESIREML